MLTGVGQGMEYFTSDLENIFLPLKLFILQVIFNSMRTYRHPWTNHHSQNFMKGLLSIIFHVYSVFLKFFFTAQK